MTVTDVRDEPQASVRAALLAQGTADIAAEKVAAKGARTPRLRYLETAVIHLTRAGVATSLETGVRLAREAIAAAAQAPVVTVEADHG